MPHGFDTRTGATRTGHKYCLRLIKLKDRLDENHRLIYSKHDGKKHFCHFQPQRLTLSMLGTLPRARF